MAVTAPKNAKYYYKFRGVSNLRWLIDILMRQRLYAAAYNELNDPMEGYFLFDDKTAPDIKKQLRDKRSVTGICSLSESYTNTLMWSFYAEDHKGICIKLAVTSEKWQLKKVNYCDELPKMSGKEEDFINLLSVKSRHWEYEKEVRFIRIFENKQKMKGSRYVSVYIDKIYLGYKMDQKAASYFTRLFKTLLPYLKDEDVVQLKREEIDTGFNNI